MTDPSIPVNDPVDDTTGTDPSAELTVTTDPTQVTVTPGTQTSEYKTTVIGSGVSLLVLLIALIHPGFKLPAETQTAIVTVLGAGIPAMIGWYGKVRRDIKTSAHAAAASIARSRSTSPAQPTNLQPPPSTLPELSDDPMVVPPEAIDGLKVERHANAGSLAPVQDDPPPDPVAPAPRRRAVRTRA